MPRPLTDDDRWLFAEGHHDHAYEVLGCHPDADGARFAVWAPNATGVSVLTDGNGWTPGADRLVGSDSGIWEGRIDGIPIGATYKYAIEAGGDTLIKSDPYATHGEVPPKTASVVWDPAYDWGDDAWMARRGERLTHDGPVSIYEVHLGSWRSGTERPYRDLARPLAEYVTRHGFTHVEFLPLAEHPFYGSWGYQVTGYFQATARYGTPQDLMYLIDTLHQAGIGVIADWVPSHFPTDSHGLGRFDGTALYEHEDPRKGFHPDWSSHVFNYGRNEVRSFLRSSANCWIERYHVDALRVDAVASMLYLDYSRKAGEWIPNEYGGRENLEAVSFLQELNEALQRRHPGVHVIAEESTAWPGVTRPPETGGLGFAWKWDMGWMNDTLTHLSRDPIHRAHHHTELTFRGMYATSEAFVLPLSHDEVVHGKGSLLGKMPGDDWQRFANLRLLLAYQWTIQGKPLLFMGGELGQPTEWDHDGSLPFELLDVPAHAGISRLVGDLNRVVKAEPALHRGDHDPGGFEWLVAEEAELGVLAWARYDPSGRARPVVVVMGTTPMPRSYRLPFPAPGRWDEVLNTDADLYGGAGLGNLGGIDVHHDGVRPVGEVTVPPLGLVVLAPEAP
jgi:1,4-alpha-glucan branching enzyme